MSVIVSWCEYHSLIGTHPITVGFMLEALRGLRFECAEHDGEVVPDRYANIRNMSYWTWVHYV